MPKALLHPIPKSHGHPKSMNKRSTNKSGIKLECKKYIYFRSLCWFFHLYSAEISYFRVRSDFSICTICWYSSPCTGIWLLQVPSSDLNNTTYMTWLCFQEFLFKLTGGLITSETDSVPANSGRSMIFLGVGRGSNSKEGLFFKTVCRKLHENERIWIVGARPWRPPWIRQ